MSQTSESNTVNPGRELIARLTLGPENADRAFAGPCTQIFPPSGHRKKGWILRSRRYAERAAAEAMRLRPLVLLVLLLVQPPVAWAEAISLFGSGVKFDSENFLFRRGSGENCVNVRANLIVNPGAGAPCTVAHTHLFGVTGEGNAAAKTLPGPSSSLYSDSATAAGVTSFGSATWTYQPDAGDFLGTTFDLALYRAEATIKPSPTPATRGAYGASAVARDPINFETAAVGTFNLEVTVDELSLALTEVSGPGSAGAGLIYAFDGNPIIEFNLLAPAGFISLGDLTITYTSVLGPSSDAGMIINILNTLVIDPALGTIKLTSPLTLFPRTEIPFSAGSHELAGGVLGTVEVAVPEPSSLLLLGSGFAALAAIAFRRQRLG